MFATQCVGFLFNILHHCCDLSLIDTSVFLILEGWLYTAAHWMLGWQYYTSATQIKVMLSLEVSSGSEGIERAKRFKHINYCMLAFMSAFNIALLSLAFYDWVT
jgi:hypothetical protein